MRFGIARIHADLRQQVMDAHEWVSHALLYENARNGDGEALATLACSVVNELVGWMKRRSGLLPPWELADIAHDAFVETALRIESIKTWPQAWVYARKVAVSMVCRRLRGGMIQSESMEDSEIADPRSSNFEREVEANDEMRVLIQRLSEKQERLLSYLLSEMGESKQIDIAHNLEVSVSTVKRRMKSVRNWLQSKSTFQPR